jgi:hypothetical protein
MRSLINFWIFIPIALAVSSIGCATGASLENDESLTAHEERLEQIQLVELNSIGLEGVELQVPEDWSFSSPHGEGSEKDLFHFNSKDGAIKGVLRVEQALPPLNRDIFVTYGEETVPSGINVISSITEQWGYQTRYLTVLEDTETASLIYQAVFSYDTIVPNKLFYILRIVDGTKKDLNEQTFKEIYSSFNLCEPSFEKRIRKNAFMFRNFQDDSWRWVDDYNDGFILRYIDGETLILAGVWTVTQEGQNLSLPQDEKMINFTYNTFIENQPVILRGQYWEDASGQVHAYAPIISRGNKYNLYIAVSEGIDSFERFLGKESLKRLLGNHLLFPR